MSDTEIPSLDDFLKSGGAPEAYEPFVAQRKEELKARADVAAARRATRTAKIRVRGGPGAWRLGQTATMIPACAPMVFDEKRGGMVAAKPEPGLTVPIGRVVEVPIRDEAHLQCLRLDDNIEIVPDDTLTHAEEEALKREAVAKAMQEIADKKKAAAKK